jgi:hypothetical protein
MSGTYKFKRIYSEGVAAEHPDVAGQEEFANKADAEITRRRKERAKKGGPQLPGFVASVKKKEVELGEAHWDPATKTISDKKRTGTDPEIQAMAAKAAASGPKKRKPLGSVRKNSVDFKPSSPEQAKADMKSWDNYWEGSWKNKKMNEKIDVGADAGATISDFVHSKSATFKGDSKKQRIKRALGAYYAAQKEETENIYNYVIETLVGSEFAEDYETAENMFEHMSSEFVAVILEEYIEEKARGTRPKRTVYAFDVDETLVRHGKKGKPNVKVHVNDASGKRVKSLSNQEFNTHKLDKGHSYDFSEFISAKKFGETSSANKKVIKDVKRKQARGQNVHIITARSKFDNPSEFQGHLKKHGVDVPLNKIHYTGGMKGSDIGKKKVDVAKGVAKQSGAKKIHMYDDAAKVNKAFEGEKKNQPTSTKIKTYLAKPNASGETQLRSYQATKGGRTSDNPSSTIKQTQRRRQRARRGMGEEMSSYEYWKQFVGEAAYTGGPVGRSEMIASNNERAKQSSTSSSPTSTTTRPGTTPTSTTTRPGTTPKPQSSTGGLLGSLDKLARDTAGKVGEKIGRNKTGNIPIISDIGGAVGKQKGTDMYDKVTAPFRKEEVSSYDYWKQFIDEDTVNEDLTTGIAGMAAKRGAAKIGAKVASKFIPGFQQASAIGDTVSDLRKGDWGRAALSAGQAIPGPAGWGFTAARMAAGEKEEAKPIAKPVPKPVAKSTIPVAKPIAKPVPKPVSTSTIPVAKKPDNTNTL